MDLQVASTQRGVMTKGHQAFPHAVRLPSGDVLLTWRGGTAHAGGTESNIRLSYSSDKGVNWTPSRRAFREDPGVDYRDPALAVTRLGLVLSYFKYPAEGGAAGCTSWTRLSTDQGNTWGPECPVGNGALSSPVVEAGGRLLQVYYDTTSRDTLRVAESTDAVTWTNHRLLAADPARDLNEPVAVKLGRDLHVYHRWGMSDGIGVTVSGDAGATWEPSQLVLTGATGRPSLLRLASGLLVMVVRRAGGDKAALVTASNGGWWWDTPQILEVPEHLMTYAALVEVDPGVVLCVFGSQSSPVTSTLYARYFVVGAGMTPRGEAVP
jgi:hypothetical protein